MNVERISITKIASHLKVSPAAVSYALRGKSGVSDELRARILSYAAQHGYRPNPINAELMSLVRANRSFRNTGSTIAYINTYSNPAYMEQESLFCQGARAAAESFGYSMEIFLARSSGMTSQRMTQILEARGIKGVLIGTRFRDDPEVKLDWTRFSAVLIGETEYSVNITRVCNNQISTCSHCLHQLAQKGYSRLGIVVPSHYEAARGYPFSIGAERFRLETGGRYPVSVLHAATPSEAEMIDWCESNRLEGVLFLGRNIGFMINELNTSKRLNVGFACLSVLPEVRLTHPVERTQHLWSGINQHYDQIGATAMELLRGLLLSGERGLSTHPKTVLRSGEWVEGCSTPGPGVTPVIPAVD